MPVADDLPSPTGRGQGEGLRICIDLRPSPGAPRHPLPVGEGHAHNSFTPSLARDYVPALLVTAPLQFTLLQSVRENFEEQIDETQHQRAEECREEPLDRESGDEGRHQPQHQRVDHKPKQPQT